MLNFKFYRLKFNLLSLKNEISVTLRMKFESIIHDCPRKIVSKMENSIAVPEREKQVSSQGYEMM